MDETPSDKVRIPLACIKNLRRQYNSGNTLYIMRKLAAEAHLCEPFHDGFTEYEEEDVGWMYMPVDAYVDLYTNLQVDGWDNYVRPPYTLYAFGDESKLVGHWRRKHQKKSSPEG